MKKKLIYLADLYHTSGSPSTPTPTNIGYVAANCIKNHKEKVEIKLFKDPHKLLDAIDERAPDILGLSNYMWNEKLNIFICQLIFYAFFCISLVLHIVVDLGLDSFVNNKFISGSIIFIFS